VEFAEIEKLSLLNSGAREETEKLQ